MEEKAVGFFSSLPQRAEKEITLPSGRVAVILEMTGHQESLFRDINKESLANLTTKFLKGVIKSLDGNPDVTAQMIDDLLQADRMVLFLHVRVLTHGNILTRKLECTECNQVSEHEIDLNEVLESVRPYPYRNERHFSLELDGGLLHFELPDGNFERRLTEGKITGVDFNRRLYVLQAWEDTPQGKIPVKIENLLSRHLAALRKRIAELEASIDGVAKLTCTNAACRTVHHVGIVGDVGFLFPNLL